MVVLIEPVTDDNIQKIKDDTAFYSLLTFLIGVAAMIGVIINKAGFGILGQNVTLEIRQLLYKSILRKNIGWFDERDNATSVLTSAMAEDTSILNGVSTESLGPMVDAGCAVLIGVGIGFYFTWKMALVCLGITPIMIIASGLGMMLEAGQTEVKNEELKPANLLCGDCIINYKTVQSLGYENMIVEKYETLL